MMYFIAAVFPGPQFWAVVGSIALTTATISGIAIGTRTRSPLLAAVVGGPTAVAALYASVVVIGLILRGPDDLSSVDWWALAALLIYPATPAFLIGLVTAAVTSFLRTSSGDKRRMMTALRNGSPTPAYMDALAGLPGRADQQAARWDGTG
jgi:hypothetical protein